MLYATLLGTPSSRAVTLVDVPVADPTRVRRLGSEIPPRADREGDGDLRIDVSSDWAACPAHSFCLGPASEVS